MRLHRLLDLLAPARCLACGRAGPPLCERCEAALPRIRGPVCDRCGRPVVRPVPSCRDCDGRRLPYATARSAVRLEGPVPALLRAWKDRGLRGGADVAAGVVLGGVPRPTVGAALVPVPPARDRARRRGVDGPTDMAARLAAGWGLPLAAGALRRTDDRPQRGLRGRDRRRNARRAFAASGRLDRPVVLVDDVLTTGATVEACATLLRAAGAPRVDVVTFARVVR